MVDKRELDFLYRQNLEEDIIKDLAVARKIDIRTAMDIYYRSKLSEQIARGEYGIDNLDSRYLAQDLIENEPELFD